MLDPNSDAARELATKYREFLRDAKKRGLKLDDAPPDALLALHQNALAVHWEQVKKERERKKKEKK